MFARISYTWEIMRASWDVLRRDKALILFPLFSCICCLLVIGSFAVPSYFTFAQAHPAGVTSGRHFHTSDLGPAHYAILFAFYFCNYFVITFFNTAIVSCAIAQLRGEPATVSDGLQQATSRIHLIAGWALLSATVGLVLRIIEDRSKLVGRLVAGLLGIAWSVAGYLVVPVLVAQNKGPIDALKESASLLRRTWGERVIGGASFGALFILFALPAIVLFIAAAYVMVTLQATVPALMIAGIGIVYLVLLGLVQSALQSIFQAAVYLYAENAQQLTQRPPQSFGFPVQLLSGAMQAKA